LLARGGGSIEDLWAFNDEKLARLIAAFNIPIVTGIGHEIDFTIADFVADLRAPTPSAAAEMAVPDQQVFFDLLADSEKKLMRSIHHLIERKLTRVKQLQAQLIHPRQLLQNQMQRLDYAKSQLITAIEKLRVHRENELKMLATILDQRSPLKLLKRGYTVLRIGDKPICSIQQATTGDAVTAQLQDGVLELTVS
jgi:exodeoxyribonuclease VII large subunit